MGSCDGARKRENNSSSNVAEYVRKASPPPFLLKTYMMVEDPATDGVVSWNEGGTAFVVWRPAEFARDLLPTLFKHCNFSSFVRQLNTYGFRKVAVNRWEFSNDMFRKGERDQLCEIRRRKSGSTKPKPKLEPNTDPRSVRQSKAQSSGDKWSPASSSSSGFTTLVDENKRLKQENGELSNELETMKRKCKELFDLAAVYNAGGLEREGGDEMIGREMSEGPKLFGVRLMEVEGKMDN